MTMPAKLALTSRLYFSYSQFLVYDQSVQLPGCAWTEAHSAQGFARRRSAVCFGTIMEFGHANVTVTVGAYQPSEEYERVIAVPFVVTSGKVIVDGPEETNVERSFDLPVGNYRLVAAQRVVGDEDEIIDLFVEQSVEFSERSVVLVADDGLNPPTPLVETAEIAGPED
jgi:hypothetical protein